MITSHPLNSKRNCTVFVEYECPILEIQHIDCVDIEINMTMSEDRLQGGTDRPCSVDFYAYNLLVKISYNNVCEYLNCLAV